MAKHQVAFPASPRLYLTDDCGSEVWARLFGCPASLTNPLSILTKPDEVLLHKRSDPIHFCSISVSAVEPDCSLGDFCLTQEKIDQWCGELRPDQAESIWCRDKPPMRFSLRTATTPGESDRDEPELAARYRDTPLGPGRVNCFYHPDLTKTDQQGASCKLTFILVDGIMATFSVRRSQITSGDPVLAETIALIPDYWTALTGGR